MNRCQLLEDIHSHSAREKGRLPYGKAGEVVRVICDRQGVLIVEGKKGQRFPVRVELVRKTK